LKNIKRPENIRVRLEDLQTLNREGRRKLEETEENLKKSEDEITADSTHFEYCKEPHL